MMITGISVGSIGLIAVGVGTGLLITGHKNCNDDALRVSRSLPIVEGAAAYAVADDRCVGESAMVNGGLAALIGGSVFSGAGIALTIAGAWKVTVPDNAAKGPILRVGLGSIGVQGTF
jgi:hypothetical protein